MTNLIDKLTDEERQRNERGEIGRTADGEPRIERGTAASAISRDPSQSSEQAEHSNTTAPQEEH